MNKKILALAMVPLLIGLSGALAFSQFSGTDNKVINATAGTLQFTESAEISAYSIDAGSQLAVAGPSAGYGYGQSNPLGGSMDLGILASGSSSDSMTYTIAAAGLSPGDWVEITYTLTNTGSVAFSASVASGSPSVTVTGGSGSPAATAVGAQSVSMTFPSGSDATGNTWLYSDMTAATFPISLFPPPSTSNVVTFNVYIGLGNGVGNGYQLSTMSYSLTIDVTTY